MINLPFDTGDLVVLLHEFEKAKNGISSLVHRLLICELGHRYSPRQSSVS